MDLQTFSSITMGVGTLMGSIWATIATAKERPLMGFGIGALVGVMITVAGALTDDALETNEYAQVKDFFL